MRAVRRYLVLPAAAMALLLAALPCLRALTDDELKQEFLQARGQMADTPTSSPTASPTSSPTASPHHRRTGEEAATPHHRRSPEPESEETPRHHESAEPAVTPRQHPHEEQTPQPYQAAVAPSPFRAPSPHPRHRRPVRRMRN